MNLLLGRLEGDHLELPMASFDLPAPVMDRLQDRRPEKVVVGIRPEHFEDAALVDRDADATFTTTVDVIEWMGSELYAHFDVEAAEKADLEDLAEDLGTVEMASDEGAHLVARLDAASEAAEGNELQLSIDIERVHLFDPDTGDNLQRDVGGHGDA